MGWGCCRCRLFLWLSRSVLGLSVWLRWCGKRKVLMWLRSLLKKAAMYSRWAGVGDVC